MFHLETLVQTGADLQMIFATNRLSGSSASIHQHMKLATSCCFMQQRKKQLNKVFDHFKALFYAFIGITKAVANDNIIKQNFAIPPGHQKSSCLTLKSLAASSVGPNAAPHKEGERILLQCEAL